MNRNAISFIGRHALLALKYAMAKNSEKTQLEAQVRYHLYVVDSCFGIKTGKYYNETRILVDTLKEKLAYYNYGRGLGILDIASCVTYYCFIRAVKPEVVIETGVASGTSTFVILKAFERNGKGILHSVDLPQQRFGATNDPNDLTEMVPKETGWLVRETIHDLGSWQLHLGDSYELLPKLLEKLRVIDVFHHDSEHTYKTMMFEYDTAFPYIRGGGYITTDDRHLTKAFNDFCDNNSLKHVFFHRLGFAKVP
jgi:cephalosporin hydroxylase